MIGFTAGEPGSAHTRPTILEGVWDGCSSSDATGGDVISVRPNREELAD